MGTMKLLSAAFQQSHRDINVEIVLGLGSGGAKRAVLQDALNIAVTSKAGKDVETAQGAVVTGYGRTPFVFATFRDNKASGLTSLDILNIYAGKTNTWPDGNRLRLILRPESDSDTEVLKRMSPAMESAMKSALSREGMKIAITDQDSADAIETIPGALGTSTLALILSEKRSIKILALDQVAPTLKNLADGTYPYFKSFYIIRKTHASAAAEKFVAFTRSPEGQKLLAGSGHWTRATSLSR